MKKSNFFVVWDLRPVAIVQALNYEKACEVLGGKYVFPQRNSEKPEKRHKTFHKINFFLKDLETDPKWREQSDLGSILILNELGYQSGRVFIFRWGSDKDLMVVFPPGKPVQIFKISQTPLFKFI